KGDDLLVPGPGFADEEQQHADAFAALDEGSGDTGHDAAGDIDLLPGRSPGAVHQVFLDVRLLRPKHLAGNAAAMGIAGIDRITSLRDELQILSRRGNRLQPVRTL